MTDEDFKERLIELMKEDKGLHDATVRLLNSLSEQIELSNADKREKLFEKYCKK